MTALIEDVGTAETATVEPTVVQIVVVTIVGGQDHHGEGATVASATETMTRTAITETETETVTVTVTVIEGTTGIRIGTGTGGTGTQEGKTSARHHRGDRRHQGSASVGVEMTRKMTSLVTAGIPTIAITGKETVTARTVRERTIQTRTIGETIAENRSRSPRRRWIPRMIWISVLTATIWSGRQRAISLSLATSRIDTSWCSTHFKVC
mmetsp:Transcript_28184/g.65042  ORF Transcript_28184/g.65042 Transcript_28184/m.65042 type:complete len:209 (-) Transcript_28184:311-937(-)